MPKKVRVHELSKELGMTLTEVLDLCASLGIGVKTHSSNLEDAQADRVRRKAAREGLIRDEPPAEARKARKSPAKAVAATERATPLDDSAESQQSPPTRPPRPATRPATRPADAEPQSQARPASGLPVTHTAVSDGSQPGRPPAVPSPVTMPPGAPMLMRPSGSKMGIIQSRYLAVCDNLILDFGATPSNYAIPEDASFQVCLGYLQKYVVAQRNHYRFNRYTGLLNPWYHENAFPSDRAEHYWDSGRDRLRFLHIDLGSGPGLFTWAVRDYLDDVFWGPSWEYESMHIGYDYSASMVDLATVLWNRLAVDSKAVWCSSQESLLALAQTPIGSCDYLLITMGHVIIQLSEQDQAELDRFADCIGQLLDCHHAPPTDILIVDAHSGSRPQQFERALKRFVAALDTPRDDAHGNRPAWHRMDLPSHVLPIGSRAAISNWREQALLRSTSSGNYVASEMSDENPF